MKMKIVNKSSNPLPKYETTGSAGLDLRYFGDEIIILGPLERALIPTGIYIELPQGYEAQVRARSGLSIKHGLTMINGVGTVDSDYRGELKIPMVNISNDPYAIKSGERVAQMIIVKHEQVVLEEVQNLNESDRGVGGFGSTGK